MEEIQNASFNRGIPIPIDQLGFTTAIQGIPTFRVGASINVFVPIILTVTPTLSQQESIECKFQKLADAWRDETRYVSSTTRITSSPSYRAIVDLGPPVVPILIQALQANPYEKWHAALHELTHANPLGPRDTGKPKAVAAAWTRWWEEH